MEIKVYADWGILGQPTLMGVLVVEHTKGREVFSFTYEQSWLKKGFAQTLDPDLALFSGRHYLAPGKKNFGIFLDSSPDRWGRVLMSRREATQARLEGRKANTLFEEDYLLGVYDKHRMGAIRFKRESDGAFQNDDAQNASPPWASLRELEYASLQLEKAALTDEESIKWLSLLLAPGASLGGARPKASITGSENGLWIAKFPSAGDQIDIGGWEMVENELARRSGLTVAEGIVRKFNSTFHSFLSRRFDRTTKNERIHFASAMTLLAATDGEPGHSYIELAEFISRYGASANEDLEELWRRIVFNILTRNTDDHLRNHGFLLTERGWRLSPAYDLNPNYLGRTLTLNIDESDNSLDVDLALSVAPIFRLTSQKATEIRNKIVETVKGWRKIAQKYKLNKSEQDLMQQSFE